MSLSSQQKHELRGKYGMIGLSARIQDSGQWYIPSNLVPVYQIAGCHTAEDHKVKVRGFENCTPHLIANKTKSEVKSSLHKPYVQTQQIQ
jgi:hypothetical protein